VGDEHGIKLADDKVTTAPGCRRLSALDRRRMERGVRARKPFGARACRWRSTRPAPRSWSASNIAFGLCPLLTLSAIEASTPWQRGAEKIYLEKLVSGDWNRHHAVTEPQAGSDVGAAAAPARAG